MKNFGPGWLQTLLQLGLQHQTNPKQIVVRTLVGPQGCSEPADGLTLDRGGGWRFAIEPAIFASTTTGSSLVINLLTLPEWGLGFPQWWNSEDGNECAHATEIGTSCTAGTRQHWGLKTAWAWCSELLDTPAATEISLAKSYSFNHT